MDENEKQDERRQYLRIKKNFILTYFVKSDPVHKYEITQLKNISLGGMCFITTKPFAPQTDLGVDLKTPYLSETTHLEGQVLESHEKVKNMIYETRLKFNALTPQAEIILTRLVDFFLSGKKFYE
jgi:c-di-GMP-binding flagellar brake protein YcgR